MEFMHWCTRTAKYIQRHNVGVQLSININEWIHNKMSMKIGAIFSLSLVFVYEWVPSMSPQANCIRFHNHEYLKIYRLTRFQLKFIQFNNIIKKANYFFIVRAFAGEMNFIKQQRKKKVFLYALRFYYRPINVRPIVIFYITIGIAS